MMVLAAHRLVALLPVRLQRTARQFVKFGVTGVIGATVDFGSYNVMSRLLGWTSVYLVVSYPIIGANLVSVSFDILSNFLINKYWTFRDPSEAVVRQGLSYFVLYAITFVLNQLLTSFFAFHVSLVPDLFGTQADNAAKVLAIIPILFLNFTGSKFIIFRRRPAAIASRV